METTNFKPSPTQKAVIRRLAIGELLFRDSMRITTYNTLKLNKIVDVKLYRNCMWQVYLTAKGRELARALLAAAGDQERPSVDEIAK